MEPDVAVQPGPQPEAHKICSICHKEYPDDEGTRSLYAEAGDWLAGEVWGDAGTLCPVCLENRARLAMMYCHDCNT